MIWHLYSRTVEVYSFLSALHSFAAVTIVVFALEVQHFLAVLANYALQLIAIT